jgi:hypothetical protein
MTTETDLVTPKEYAHYRRCSVRTLDRERAEGRGCPYLRLGGRILYRRADIERHLAENVHRNGTIPASELGPVHTGERAYRGRARRSGAGHDEARR